MVLTVFRTEIGRNNTISQCRVSYIVAICVIRQHTQQTVNIAVINGFWDFATFVILR